MALEDALNILLQGYTKGGSSGSGLMISKSGSTASLEVRVGVSHSYIVLAQTLGGKWLERNLSPFLGHLLVDILSHPKSIASHVEAVHSRR